MSKRINEVIQENENVLIKILDEKNPSIAYQSMMTSSLIKANLRALLYELKLIELKNGMTHDELIKSQMEVAKILVSMMKNYFGDFDDSPYFDTFYLNIFYGNYTFEMEDYFEIFEHFYDDVFSNKTNYVEAFRKYQSLELNEHLHTNEYYLNVLKLFEENSQSASHFVHSLSQLFLIFKKIVGKSESEGYKMPTSESQIKDDLEAVLNHFEKAITQFEDNSTQVTVARNYQAYMQGPRYVELYESADPDDFSGEIDISKVDPETREAMRVLDILHDDWGGPHDAQNNTYILAWADLVLKDTSSQQFKIREHYGPIISNNEQAYAALKAGGSIFFGGDPMEKYREESYEYLKLSKPDESKEISLSGLTKEMYDKSHELTPAELSAKAIEIAQRIKSHYERYLVINEIEFNDEFFGNMMHMLTIGLLISDDDVDDSEYSLYENITEALGVEAYLRKTLEALPSSGDFDSEIVIKSIHNLVSGNLIKEEDVVEYLTVISLINGEFSNDEINLISYIQNGLPESGVYEAEKSSKTNSKPSFLDLEIKDKGATLRDAGDDDYYFSIGLKIENSNPNHMARNITLKIIAEDDDGRVVISETADIYQIDASSVFFFGEDYYTDDGEPTNYRVRISVDEYVQVNRPLTDGIELGKFNLKENYSGSTVTGNVTNNYSKNLNAVELYLVAIDDNGKILAGARTIVFDLFANETEGFECDFKVDISEATSISYGVNYDIDDLD